MQTLEKSVVEAVRDHDIKLISDCIRGIDTLIDDELASIVPSDTAVKVLKRAIELRDEVVQTKLARSIPDMDLSDVNSDILINAEPKVRELAAYQGLMHAALINDTNPDVVSEVLLHPEFDVSLLPKDSLDNLLGKSINNEARTLVQELVDGSPAPAMGM